MAKDHRLTFVYAPPLSPVSEAESDTTATISSNTTNTSATSNGSTPETSRSSKRPLNFSRPTPVDFSPAHRLQHDIAEGQRDAPSNQGPARHRRLSLPLELDFSVDNKEIFTPNTIDEHCSADDFPWDAHLKPLRPLRRFDYEAQRSGPRLLNRASSTRSRPLAELPASKPIITQLTYRPRTAPAATSMSTIQTTYRPKPISAKRIPPQVIPQEADEDEWDGEDVRSHHTVSENDEDEQQQKQKVKTSWLSSTFDTGSLGEGEVRKLRKKGINPALYAEMKAARKGRGRWINPLTGNTFLS